MEVLVRFVQAHEAFRKAELEAIASLLNIKFEFIFYDEDSPFCIIRVKSEAEAQALVQRSILSKGAYELWGRDANHAALHEDVRRKTQTQWPLYKTCSFKFEIDTFRGKHSTSEQRKIIETFDYLNFLGPIIMRDPEHTFCVFEDYDLSGEVLRGVYFGRWIARSGRDVITKHDLKKRSYISTTSMDAELALVTANLTCAAPGKLFLDPFVGTGGFPVACAHFGALCLGSDIDSRSVRGKTPGRNILSNFKQYGLSSYWLDSVISDLTNTPIRTSSKIFDGILCDPPYGVREGLRVLGRKEHLKQSKPIFVSGKAAYLQPGFVPPKKPYSFDAMLADILEFAALTLVDHGRLSFWMPTANDDSPVELDIPSHPCLELVSGHGDYCHIAESQDYKRKAALKESPRLSRTPRARTQMI
ncbi:MAG: hypothetical protein M4579_001029 [Chaenotheca gracillima]|nr:MAG: hypothetical protein M4579_001029 [Chaenotheca gracillima]